MPEYLLIDASDAEYNAARNVFGDKSIILMCWFHVIKNIFDSVKSDLNYLHFALFGEFESRKREDLQKWAADKSLDEFSTYFQAQRASFGNGRYFTHHLALQRQRTHAKASMPVLSTLQKESHVLSLCSSQSS